ncbi:MAG TPA: esterase [Saprospirales bacterium]|nr:esterase [Saprospirales bacterium]
MRISTLLQRPLFFLFLIISCSINAQENKVVIGAIDSVQSNILGELRKVMVYMPDGSANNQQRYPVVYLLDGEGNFTTLVGILQYLSTGGNNFCPKMIVVGIPNTDRTRDLTPTHVDVYPPFMDSASCKTSGGGENFIAFIEKELMPHIEAKYPTAPYKMLIGHSFGGLAVMQTFVHHTDLFNAYICIDPSMWWDNQKLLQQARKALVEKKFNGKSMYLAIANTLEEGMNIKTVYKDTSAASRHIRSILNLQAAFEKDRLNGLKFSSKYYPNETHGSVPLMAQYDALRFFFDFFPLNFSMQEYTDSTISLADKYDRHFAKLSREMGYQIKPDEAEINFIGYELLKQKHYRKAADLFKLNVANYPGSFNVYDSYGDYFISQKDTINAIIQLKKALALKENPGSRQKLEALEGVNARKVQLPPGFPLECPVYDPQSKKRRNHSPARKASDDLVKQAEPLLNQLS